MRPDHRWNIPTHLLNLVQLRHYGSLLMALVAATGGTVSAQRPTEAASIRGFLAQGDAAWNAADYRTAKEAYRRVVAQDSNASSRAVYRLATAFAWDGELDRGIALFRHYVFLEPKDEEGRIALGKTLAWANRSREAVAIYDSILSRDSTYRDAALGAAQVLAWAGEFDAALSRYAGWISRYPNDREALLARARTLAWANRLGDAEGEFSRLARTRDWPDAEKGVALVAAWRGDFSQSEMVWRKMIVRAPEDPEVWVGLAQVLRWTGRPEEAAEALQRALRAKPGHADALEQMRWVRAELATTFEPSGTTTWDSDHNRATSIGATLRVAAFRRARLLVSAHYRTADLDALHANSTGARFGLTYVPFPSWFLRLEGGGTNTRSSGGASNTSTTTFVGTARLSGPVTTRLRVGAGVATGPFDETATLIARGIHNTAYDLDADLALPLRLTLSGGVGITSIEGGTEVNSRHSGNGALRLQLGRQTSIGVAGRTFRYDHSLHDGYFAPKRYDLVEAVARYGVGRDLGWAFTAEGALGQQRVTFDSPSSSGTQRINASVSYRPIAAGELAIGYSFANVASAVSVAAFSAGSLYHASSLFARVKWPL